MLGSAALLWNRSASTKLRPEVADEMLRQRVVVQVVARVQVANTDARFSESDGFPGSSKLGEFFAQMPGELSRADRLTVAAILRDGRKVLIPSESRWNA